MHTSFFLFNLVFALLVALFWLLFRQKSYFQFNRFLLLGLLPLAILLPKAPSLLSTEVVVKETIEFSVGQFSSPVFSDPLPAQMQVEATDAYAWSLLDGILALYFLGMILFAARFLWQNYRLLQFIKKAPRQIFEDYIMVTPQVATMPFSFFKYLVLPKEIQTAVLKHQIIQHELVHIRQWHSLDLMMANLLKIICWWNPMVWLYRNLIEQNQEFLVDQVLLKAGVNAKTYQFSLLKIQFPSELPLLTNSYNFSFIKKRIQMMQGKLNPRRNWSSYVLFSLSIAPLLLLFGRSNPSTTPAYLNNGDDKGVLIVYDQNTTYQELKSLQVPLEKLGFMFNIEEYRVNQLGTITDISIVVDGELGEQFKSNYNVPVGKQPEPFIKFFYLDFAGEGSCGGLSKERFDRYLRQLEELELFTLGNIPSQLQGIRSKLPSIPEGLSETEKANIRSNNYRGKSVVASSTHLLDKRGPEYYEKAIKDVKIHIHYMEKAFKLKAKYYLNGESVDASVLEQKLKEVVLQNFSRPVYDKDYKEKMWENYEIKVLAKNQ